MKRCKHETRVLYHAILFDKDGGENDIYGHPGPKCADCGAWLSLGPSNDEPEAVRVEMRAASKKACQEACLIAIRNGLRDECTCYLHGAKLPHDLEEQSEDIYRALNGFDDVAPRRRSKLPEARVRR